MNSQWRRWGVTAQIVAWLLYLEDDEWCALGFTFLGEGWPFLYEMRWPSNRDNIGKKISRDGPLHWNRRNIWLLNCSNLRNPTNIRMTEDKQLSYGWLRFCPTWLQFLNTPKWFLFFLGQYFFTQSIVVNGVYPGSISTIEKRFGFSRSVPERQCSTFSLPHVRGVILRLCRWQGSRSHACLVAFIAKKDIKRS